MANIVYLASGAEAIAEFARQVADPAFATTPNITPGSYHTATCVEDMALMMAMAVAPQRFHYADSQFGDELQAIVNAWRAADPAIDPNGASSYVDATNWLRGQGFTVDENLLDTPGFDWWDEMVRGIPQGYVYGIGVTNAQALHGDEAGVHNHGFTAFGLDSDGDFLCGDGDNWAANQNMPGDPVGAFVTYSRQDLINAQISSVTRIHPMAMIPTGWSDDGTTLTAPNHVTVTQGFRDYILAHIWDDFNWPLDDVYYPDPVDPEAPQVGGGSRQDFREGSLGWTQALGVTRVWVGDELLALRAEVAKLTANPPPPPGGEPDADDAALAAAQAQVTQLGADKAQLLQEVAALQAQLANAHATLSQQAADAITAIEALGKALADPTPPAPPAPGT